MNTQILGKWGEAKAAEYLRKKKYKLVGVNYRTRFGEIDLIAEDKSTVVFVEVKLRKNAAFGKPEQFVTKSKQQKINLSARVWLARNCTDKVVRFDIIEVYAPDGISDNYTINHIENAFYGSAF